MTASFLPPVIPTAERAARPVASPAGAGRRPPPLPALHPGAGPTATVYALCAVEKGGRLGRPQHPAGAGLAGRPAAGHPRTRRHRRRARRRRRTRHRQSRFPAPAVDGAPVVPAVGRLVVAANPTSGELIAYPIPVLHRLLADAHTPGTVIRREPGAGKPGRSWKRPGCCWNGWGSARRTWSMCDRPGRRRPPSPSTCRWSRRRCRWGRGGRTAPTGTGWSRRGVTGGSTNRVRRRSNCSASRSGRACWCGATRAAAGRPPST